MTVPFVVDYPLLQAGEPTRGYVACNDYFYYRLPVDTPCMNINLYLTTAFDNHTLSAELAVGQWPNVVPTFNNLEWTSYNWLDQNLTIAAWDPAFDGGKSCGPNGTDTCELIVGVVGYCNDNSVAVDYILTATLSRVVDMYEVPQHNQKVAPQATKHYGFCVDEHTDTTATITAVRDACSCPVNYTDIQMVISRTNRDADLTDRVWRLNNAQTDKSITLYDSDPNYRLGTYYLNVFGQCTEDSLCSDRCTCGPCSNLVEANWSLFVGPSSKYEVPEGSCPSQSFLPYTCNNLCSSTSSESLSQGDVAGIAIGALVFAAIIIVAIIFVVRGWNKHETTFKSSRTQQQDFDEMMVFKGQSSEGH